MCGRPITYEAALEQLHRILDSLKSDSIKDLAEWRDIGQSLLVGNPYILGTLAARFVPELRDVPAKKIAKEYLMNTDIGMISVLPDTLSNTGSLESGAASDEVSVWQGAPRRTRVFLPGAASVQDKSLTDGVIRYPGEYSSA